MEKEIFVKYITENQDFNILIHLYKQENINCIFSGYRPDRLLASEYSFLIYLDDVPIGFILCVRELQRKKHLSIDIALLEEYRNNGYGKKALEFFKQFYLLQIPEDLLVEVSKNNVPANNVKNIFNLQYIEAINNSNVYEIKRNI